MMAGPHALDVTHDLVSEVEAALRADAAPATLEEVARTDDTPDSSNERPSKVCCSQWKH